MNGMLEECVADCPYCGERIDVFVDVSAGDQTYIEDCFVCCRPIQMTVIIEDDSGCSLNAEQSH